MRTFLAPLAFTVLVAPLAACARSGCCRPCTAPPPCTPCGENRSAPPPPVPTPPPLGAPQTALRLRYYDVKDLVQPGEASADAFEEQLRTVVPHAESLAIKGRVVIARATVPELDELGRWLEARRGAPR